MESIIVMVVQLGLRLETSTANGAGNAGGVLRRSQVFGQFSIFKKVTTSAAVTWGGHGEVRVLSAVVVDGRDEVEVEVGATCPFIRRGGRG